CCLQRSFCSGFFSEAGMRKRRRQYPKVDPKVVLGAVFVVAAFGAGSAAAAAEQVRGAQVDLPGGRLWFTDTGGAGTPIVLLHSNTGTSEIWQPQIADFGRAGYRVIAFDRRGWGRSVADPASGPQPGSIAGDLDLLADHLKLERFQLLGLAG